MKIDEKLYNSLVIVRFYETDTGVFGKLFLNDTFICYTLENLSTLIPVGVFDLDLNRVSPKFKNRLPYSKFKGVVPCINVPNRYGILIHAGCFPSDSSGCVLVGLNWYRGQNRLYNSQSAYIKLFSLLKSFFYPVKVLIIDIRFL